MPSGRSGPDFGILEAIVELDEADRRSPCRCGSGSTPVRPVVTLGAKPAEGEGIVTGDVVNTASRIQGVAPVGGIAVGEQTYLATINVFTYEALEPVELKGKSSPVSIWRPTAARSRFGVDVTRAHTTPFVGRDADLALLKATFEKSLRESSVQLVTIVGEPGAGKSRIVAELQRFMDDRPELVTWRQGRCLPYGDGITFWALGEIVKAQAGIFETDEQEVAADKLDAMIPPGDADREWLRLRFAPLVGLASDPGTAREELFTAWRRFLESVAELAPPCSSSRTSIGPTSRCSRSSSTSPSGQRAFRCSSSARLGLSCTSVIRTGRRGSGRRQP